MNDDDGAGYRPDTAFETAVEALESGTPISVTVVYMDSYGGVTVNNMRYVWWDGTSSPQIYSGYTSSHTEFIWSADGFYVAD